MVQIEKIVAVGNKPGLYKLIASKGNGLILEDLTNGKTNFYSSRTFQFSPLESIGIYSLQDTIPLKEVYERFSEKEDEFTLPATDAEDASYKSYFEQVLPEYDPYRVHLKDMKKCIRWYHQLKSFGFINKSSESKSETTDES